MMRWQVLPRWLYHLTRTLTQTNLTYSKNFEFCTPVRDTLREFLSKNGVGTIVQWGGFGIHQLEGLGLKASLPITDKFFQNSLLIPLNCEMDDDQVDYIIDILIEFYEKGGI